MASIWNFRKSGKSLPVLQKLEIEIDQEIGATDTWIEKRVYEVYEELKKKDKISEKHARTWFDPFEKEFYDDVTFKSRSTPLTLAGLYTALFTVHAVLSDFLARLVFKVHVQQM